ncbi:MAG: ATP-binding protein [Leptospiraceae bacterium]|nr:ATP-binding protein [Leptospiraceae bacterium]MCP5501304.1 ATP-binding protein [Leptospiraceae bacterium]
MACEIFEPELEKELCHLSSLGLSGNLDDFVSWLHMSFLMKTGEEVEFSKENVGKILDKLIQCHDLYKGGFDNKEFCLKSDSKLMPLKLNEDRFTILGHSKFSPIQFVKSRLEFFLTFNGVSEEDIIDISIATIEAVENAVKYGDGNEVDVDYYIEQTQRIFHISVTNKIKEFELDEEIERGKYSAKITLMRGVMVMQKLFDQIDLSIIEDKKQARLTAIKKIPA